MPGSAASFPLPFSRLNLTRRHVLVGASALIIIAVAATAIQFSQAKDAVLPTGSTIGGDFVAFFGAANAAVSGEAASIYDQAAFETLLMEIAPPNESYGLSWQYPPTFYLLIFPLAYLAYLPGYVAAMGVTGAVYFSALRAAGAGGLALLVIAASPTVFHNILDGQNGFLTAGLLTIAALYPDKRPVLAGLAAALLTVKPQLGLLLPLAYIAAGCWRAFAVAAAGTLVLTAVSLAVFGVDAWIGFRDGAGGAWDNLLSGVLPISRMATPLAAGVYLGLPAAAALAIHVFFAISTAAFVAIVWRRLHDSAARAAALCAGVFLAAPYGYLYELTILAIPALFLARRALQHGWLPYEQLFLIAAFLTPTLARGDPASAGVSWGFISVLIIAVSVWRRIDHEFPGALPKFRAGRSGAPA